jgi:mannosyltransferase OCH1-like enzyme
MNTPSITTNELNVTISRSIPRIIYQTWESKDLSLDMAKAVQTLKDANPYFRHELYDDTDCRNFIKSYFSSEILFAYDSLNPGAYKADLWRYCILYVFGGIYLDIKYIPVDGFSFEKFIDKEHLCKDRPEYDWNRNSIYNALIIAHAGNLYLKHAIQRIYLNCVYKNYCYSLLYITGPGLLSEIVPKDYEYSFTYLHPDQICFNGTVVLKGYDSYREWTKKHYAEKNQLHYIDAWNRRTLYK